jgi:tetratricopeptide (TPR) repeat protein
MMPFCVRVEANLSPCLSLGETYWTSFLMEDLNGLSWTSSSDNARKPPSMSSSSLFSSIRPTPTSGLATPPSGVLRPSNPPSKSSTPADDSFAGLVSFGASNSDKTISLLEQQKRLQEQRIRKEVEKKSRFEAQYGGQNSQFWESLGQAGSKPHITGSIPSRQNVQESDEDDLLAAFSALAPVDSSTNFPIPSSRLSPQLASSTLKPVSNGLASGSRGHGSFPGDGEDDDPFGLGQMSSKPESISKPNQDDGDDFLGLLAKPVSEFPRPEMESLKINSLDGDNHSPSPQPSHPRDQAIAEMVDMGFPADKANEALANTESGVDVQVAVGWLLNQESKQEAQANSSSGESGGLGHVQEREGRRRDQSEKRERNHPGWMTEGDPYRPSGDIGNRLFKTANSLWKSGSKKVQQAVHDLNNETDSNQPRWMRDRAFATENQRSEVFSRERQRPDQGNAHHINIDQKSEASNQLTDEALLLESGVLQSFQQPIRQKGGVRQIPENASTKVVKETKRDVPGQRQPRVKEARSRLTRSAVEEQPSPEYISPARRRRPATQQKSERSSESLDGSTTAAAANAVSKPRSPKKPPPKPVRTGPPPRTIPEVRPSSLTSSHQQCQRGTEAYNRGDYSAAHESFARALSMLPVGHPVTLIFLCNRAMTALNIGEPKLAIADADSILAVIGPSKGEAEVIELGNGEPAKPMKEFFGKALMRKAEALEQLERWDEAAKIWRQAVETGHGGSTSIQGRNRCEKAAGISKPVSQTSVPVGQRLSVPKSSVQVQPSTEAVSRLRAANEAADRIDEEKFALADSIQAKVAAWKGDNQDNLRTLLTSLDSVLWPEAGWKKINLSEVVSSNKVKVQYMKAIAKVHPDKVRRCCVYLPRFLMANNFRQVPINATTEQRMIASAVFSSLNEAWDKFRKQNNL